ncbi:MAG: potassium/proton antiporter [Anaerocolumna sp.]|jgi:cell volume regulation protein A|nr:potassium/proton antiporter [Anaerocolumna sp.]
MAFTLLIGAVIVILCIVASKFSNKFGMPSLLLFMALGMLFGSDGIFKIPFDNYEFAEQICSFALIFILFYGGFGTNWKMAKTVAVKSVLLATIGVIITAFVTALFCFFALGFDKYESFLIGAVISSTDAASVFSILRSKKLNLKFGTSSLLELESGSNDPIAFMLTIIAMTLMAGGGIHTVTYMLFAQIVYGVLIGVIIALVSSIILKKVNFFTDGFDTLFVFAIAVLAYALATKIGGNGYLATYLAGIILGNTRIQNKITLVHFFDGITNLSQIIIFFLLGLLAFPHQIPAILISSLAITIFLTFVARPVAVFSILSPFRCNLNQQLLISWAGLRGASAIVFAVIATVSEISTTNDVYHIAFSVALFSVAIQGTLLPMMAKKLQMVDYDSNVLKTFNDYQEEASMQLIKMQITKGHEWINQSISAITVLSSILVVMIRREGETIIPNGNTIIHLGDTLILSGETYRDDTNLQLKEINIDLNHEWTGKKIKDIELSTNSLAVMIKRKDESNVVPNGDTIIKAGDTLVISDFESSI